MTAPEPETVVVLLRPKPIPPSELDALLADPPWEQKPLPPRDSTDCPW